jgi:3-methyladenine DNA glycosylase AlkD
MRARERARAIVASLRGEADAVVLREAMARYAGGEIWLAYEVLRAAPRAMSAATVRSLEALSAGMASWGHVDCFACFAGGVAWRIGRIDDQVVARWARSRDRWRRRAALVSTVPLNCRARGATAAKGEASRTLAVCELLVDDRDDMVVKAMSWALRELAKRDGPAVRRFLKAHGEQLAARVRREVANKLSTGLKSPRRKQVRRRQ